MQRFFISCKVFSNRKWASSHPHGKIFQVKKQLAVFLFVFLLNSFHQKNLAKLAFVAKLMGFNGTI